MAIGVLVLAAGSGSRLGAAVPKAFVRVGDSSLLGYAVRSALATREVACVVVAAPAGWLDAAIDETEPLSRAHGIPVQVVPGGAERGDSVLAAVRWLPQECDIVLVHDAARAFAPPELFDRVAAAVTAAHPAVVPGEPVIDTIKVVDEAGIVVATPERSALRVVQTPQGFRRDVLLRAHHEHGSLASDDAGLVERLGLPVLVIPGDGRALKVTTPDDLDRAHRLAQALAPDVGPERR
ncbi:MAG: 2-C-methyl-D-erythritol 4-phosphate cytidylyltransferase [Actinomycetales bacterium]|nr:2-C-methyl-D-erythritol 4-phosphate cytidylyltransferase [Actinomycetales bacterium]